MWKIWKIEVNKEIDTGEQIERYRWKIWKIEMNKEKDTGEQIENTGKQIERYR